MSVILIKTLQLLLCLSLLIVLHEGGHFGFAKLFKVRVEKFFMFFDYKFHLFSTRDNWFTRLFPRFKNNETEAVLTKQVVVSCDANMASEPGEYPITLSGAEAENYDISYTNGKLIVTQAYIHGDVNGDGEVNVADLVAVSNHMAGDETVSKEKADVNSDGEVNVADLVAISNIMSGNAE